MIGSPQPKKPYGLDADQRKRIRKLCKKLWQYPLFQFRKNAKYRVAELLYMAINAALNDASLEATSAVDGRMSADDALLHLKDKALIDRVEQMLFELLDSRFLRLLKRKFPNFQKWIAIDFTPESFYGDKNCPYVTGYEPKDGTYYCFKFMTISLLLPQGKYLLFAYPTYRDTDRIWLLNHAFGFLKRLGIKPELCLIDREFYAVDVLAFFRENEAKYLMPAKHDSKFERCVRQMKQLPGIFRGYEITNDMHESEWTNLIVMESDWTERKEVFGFVTNLHESVYRDDAYLLADIYRKRWIIETAHRVHDNFRVKTCCKEGNVRYFFFVIAVLLYNLWIYINLVLCCVMPENQGERITVYAMKRVLRDEFLEKRFSMPVGIAM